MNASPAKAMLFTAANTPFSSLSVAFPSLQKGEILVRNLYATICASDLHTFHGRRKSCHHSVLGHEIVGRIEALAEEGAKDYHGRPLEKGDRITWSVYAHDPASPTSLKGFPQKSEDLYKYGHEQIDDHYQLNGGFSTHCHLRKGTSLFKLPEALTDREAAPLNCTHATIAGAMRLAGSLSGKTVLVNGAGMLGLSACAMAKEKGASHVWACDLSIEKATHAKAFGADTAFEAESKDVPHRIFGPDKADIIIETSGMPEAMENCLHMLGIGGTIILVGAVFPQRNLSINAEFLVRNLLTIKGLHNYIPEDLATAISFLTKAKAKYPFDSLVGREFSLEQLDSAFEAGSHGKYYRVGVKP